MALRYTAFQLPGLTLAVIGAFAAWRWFELSAWLACLGVAAWMTKDLVMFPFVRTAYEPGDGASAASRMLGTEGVAEEPLDPEGYVRVGSELWRARIAAGAAPVPAGGCIRVEGIRGLTLDVCASESPKR